MVKFKKGIIMFNLIKKYKLMKERKKQEEIILKNEQKKERELKLSIATKNMLSKNCPLNYNRNCSSNCIHFKPGSIGYWGYELGYISFNPKCKLWK